MQAKLTFTTNTISSGLMELQRRGGNLSRVMEAIGEEAVAITKEAFRDEAVRPSPWAPRKNTHFEKRTYKNGMTKTVLVNDATNRTSKGMLLRRTGAMYNSITITRVENFSVTFGTDRPYAGFHQFGTKHMPARPFFPFDAAGNLTPVACERLQAVGEAKLAILLKP